MLVLGDEHGQLERFKSFLQYSQGQAISQLGDLVDSFVEPDENILGCLDLMIKYQIPFTWGNHEIGYILNIGCAGRRPKLVDAINLRLRQMKAFGKIFLWEQNDDTLTILSHGGIGGFFARKVGLWNDLSISEIIERLDALNKEMDIMIDTGIVNHAHPILMSSPARAGWAPYSGPLWYDPERDVDDLWTPPNVLQVFGHTNTNKGIPTVYEGDLVTGIKSFIDIDVWGNYCYNTETQRIERF